MFRTLRKVAIWVVVAILALLAFLLLRNPDHQRYIAQKFAESREMLGSRKPPVWEGTVVVVDAVEGDKAIINTETSTGITVRLAGIDAPEMPEKFKRNGQPLAEESRDYLASLVQNKAVQMTIVATDTAMTPLVLFTVEGECVNPKVTAAGFAEAAGDGLSAMPVKIKHEILNGELLAQREKRKIWSLPNYVRPVEHRIRQQRANTQTPSK